MAGTPFGSSNLNLDAGYGYDTEGNVTSVQYPDSQFNTNNTTVGGPGYTYGYDTMKRLQSMTDKANTAWVKQYAVWAVGRTAVVYRKRLFGDPDLQSEHGTD